MPKLFGVDMAQIINTNMGPGLLPVTLVKQTKAYSADGTDISVAASMSFVGRGFIESYSDEEQSKNSLIEVGDRKITILGASLPPGIVPKKGDHVIVEDGTWYLVEIPKRDPAAATYLCHGRG